ncbi:MAG: transcription elongation factor [Deltaproteobacteria bacterium]
MPTKKTIDKAKQALRKGKSPSTAAGEFIREEMDRIGDGKHGAGSPKQAIAIGLAKARRAGIPLRPQPESPADERSRRAVERAYEAGQKKKAAAPTRTRRARTAPTLKPKRKPPVAKSAPSRRAKPASRRAPKASGG